jgi:monovalent cation:H+ antiporter, CPA1 family
VQALIPSLHEWRPAWLELATIYRAMEPRPMHEDGVSLVVIGAIELLLLASLAAVVLRRIRFPYTIGLVVVGILLALLPEGLRALEPIRSIRLTPDAVLYLFVPTLIFPAAVHLDPRMLRENLTPVLLLAFPGVILSAVIVGAVVGSLPPLSWGAALLFGALIAATDPIAVVALFKDMKVSGRLAILVDGESLLNDAVAVVLFAIVLDLTRSGVVGPVALWDGAMEFVLVSAGGLGVGVVLAVMYAWTVRLAENDPLVEIALSVVLAYTAFVVAHHYLGVSGIMAVVGAGLTAAALRRGQVGTGTRAYLEHYWSYAEFVANSFVFLSLGLGGSAFLHRLLERSAAERTYIGCAILAVIAARLIAVPSLIGLSNRFARIEPIGWRQQAIMFWGGGLRGALPLVMALSLPLDFEPRSLIVDMTAGVVLFTLLVQGTTVGRLIRAYGVN